MAIHRVCRSVSAQIMFNPVIPFKTCRVLYMEPHNLILQDKLNLLRSYEE